MRTPRPVLTALLLLIAATTALGQPAEPVDLAGIDPADHAYDDWYLDRIDGQPGGYWHAWLAVEADSLISGYEEVGVESHGGEELRTLTRIVWTETLDYQPVTIVVETESGSDTVTQTYRFTDDGIELTSSQAGRSIGQVLPPIDGDYLTAAQAAIVRDLCFARGDKAFEYNTLDPLVGMSPFVTRYQRAEGDAAPFELADGERVNASQWAVTFSALPGFEMREWIDAEHRSVGCAFDLGGMTLVSMLADPDVAQTEFDPPEMAHLSVVVPDRPIEKPRSRTRIVYELGYRAGESAVAPIRTAQQSVEPLGPGRARVTVDLDAKPGDDAPGNAPPTDANLASTIRIDHKDEVIRGLAERAVARVKNPADQQAVAAACRRAVSGHLVGASLGVGDATASEAARTRRGDCTECAVLLAAILRAHGIPSRCVSGLVYSESGFVGQRDVFVYHMWTQAWLEDDAGQGRWVDLDAAQWRYTAGHIALGVSNMGDDDQQDFIRLIPMMQGLEIKVLETSD